MGKRFAAVLLGALVVAVVVGCGGDDTDSGDNGATSSLTKAEFVEEANAVCLQGEKAIEDRAEEFAEENDVDTENPSEADQEQVIVEVLAPGLREQAEGLSELGAPEGDEEQVEAIVAAVESGADALEEDPAALLNGDSPLEEASKLAGEYGLTECGQ